MQAEQTPSSALWVAYSTGILLAPANVISSQSFIQLAMFGLELEWTVGGGVGGGGKARRRLPEETVEKQNTP